MATTTTNRRDIQKDGLGFFVFFFSMKWGIFDAGTKSTGERGSGRIYKNLAEFTKNASEGVLLLQEWKIFCIFALSFSTQDNKKVYKMIKDSIEEQKRKTVCCPKCGRQTSFDPPSDAIDEEGEFYRCQHCGWPFHYK